MNYIMPKQVWTRFLPTEFGHQVGTIRDTCDATSMFKRGAIQRRLPVFQLRLSSFDLSVHARSRVVTSQRGNRRHWSKWKSTLKVGIRHLEVTRAHVIKFKQALREPLCHELMEGWALIDNRIQSSAFCLHHSCRLGENLVKLLRLNLFYLWYWLFCSLASESCW